MTTYNSIDEEENHQIDASILAERQAFREHMDRKSRERKLAKRLERQKRLQQQENSPATQSLRTFESWSEVTKDFKTRKQWLRAGRRVGKQEAPSARVVCPELIFSGEEIPHEATILDEQDDFSIVTDQITTLFHESQTNAYTPKPRTKAYWEFEEIFLRYARKDSWIRKTDKSGAEQEDWITEHENPFETNVHRSNRLSDQHIRQHINQKQIIGIKGGRFTRSVVIDLDFHGRDLELFERQAEILLDRFHGTGTWHYQVKRHDVTGLQLIQVFEKPRELETAVAEIRDILVQLDMENPDQSTAAKSCGMKSLANLEIYPTPNNGNGVRLPLCRDREMFLDAPLPLQKIGEREVQNVEAYIAWLTDPNRKYMPKEQILGYLHYHAYQAPRTRSKTKPSSTSMEVSSKKRWKGNMRKLLYEFWVDGNHNDIPLNEHLVVIGRLAAAFGYSDKEICEGLERMVRSLPESARDCSSRLLSGAFKKIDRVIQSTAEYVCNPTGHQPMNKESKEIFAGALSNWQGFDPLNTKTWKVPIEKAFVAPNWTDEQIRRLVAFFKKPLFVKDEVLIMRFINAIVQLTCVKEKEGNGWGTEYLMKWMKSNFPEIKCGNDQKRQNIIDCLKDEGIIRQVIRGRAFMYATHWTLGSVARQAYGFTDDVLLQTIQVDPMENISTSIYYTSIFYDEANFTGICDVQSEAELS